MFESSFYSFEEMSKVLHDKFNASHEEIIWWVNFCRIYNPYVFFAFKSSDIDKNMSKSYGLIPYLSEFPDYDHRYYISDTSPLYCFYKKSFVDGFVPFPQIRLVTIGDLSAKRNWTIYGRNETNMYSQFPSLDIAAREGILRFYDGEDFTTQKTFKSGDMTKNQLWYKTHEGEEMLSQPTTFFLLEDIIKIERLFLNRPYHECEQELGLSEEKSYDN